MTTTRSVALAHSALSSKIIKMAGTNSLYRHPDFPGIVLREIPTGSITQFGGFVTLQRHSDGRIRTIGAAGAWIGKFKSQSKPGRALLITYASNVVGRGKTKAWGMVAKTDGTGYATVNLHAAAPVAVELTETPYTDGVGAQWPPPSASTTWAAANITDELILGWVCPVNSGIIWQGDVHVVSMAGSTDQFNHYVCYSGATMAVHVDAPIKVDWSKVDLAAIKANYLSGADPAVRDYISRAWDQVLPTLTAIKTIYQPVPVLLSTRGLEISPSFGQYLVPSSQVFQFATMTSGMFGIGVSGNTPMPDETNTPPALPYGATVSRLAGACIGGLVMPRIPHAPMPNSAARTADVIAAYQNALDPGTLGSNASLPVTITGLPAAPLLGPAFPAAYAADRVMNPAGEMSISSLINVLENHEADLQNPQVQQVAGDGSTTQGDASILNEGSAFTTLSPTLLSYGYGFDYTMKQFVTSVRAKAEALLREDKGTFGF